MRRFSVREAFLIVGVLAASPVSGAVKVHVMDGRPFVNGVYLNGHGPYRFLVDTGTTLNHFDPKLMKSAGLKAGFRTQLMSSTGFSAAEGADGIEVRLDSVRMPGQKFLFAGLDALHERYPEVDGVLGQEFLSRFDYLLDLNRGRLEFGTAKAPEGKTRASFRVVAGRPVVSTNLGSLVLDSGVNQVTLFHAEEFSLTHRLITMTGTVPVGMVSRHLIIDGRTLWRGSAVAVPRPAETEAAGLLPANLFRTIYVSNSDGYLALD